MWHSYFQGRGTSHGARHLLVLASVRNLHLWKSVLFLGGKDTALLTSADLRTAHYSCATFEKACLDPQYLFSEQSRLPMSNPLKDAARPSDSNKSEHDVGRPGAGDVRAAAAQHRGRGP